MSDEPTGRLIELGTFPTSGGEIFTYDHGKSLMIREAIARADCAQKRKTRKAKQRPPDIRAGKSKSAEHAKGAASVASSKP